MRAAAGNKGSDDRRGSFLSGSEPEGTRSGSRGAFRAPCPAAPMQRGLNWWFSLAVSPELVLARCQAPLAHAPPAPSREAAKLSNKSIRCHIAPFDRANTAIQPGHFSSHPTRSEADAASRAGETDPRCGVRGRGWFVFFCLFLSCHFSPPPPPPFFFLFPSPLSQGDVCLKSRWSEPRVPGGEGRLARGEAAGRYFSDRPFEHVQSLPFPSGRSSSDQSRFLP